MATGPFRIPGLSFPVTQTSITSQMRNRFGSSMSVQYRDPTDPSYLGSPYVSPYVSPRPGPILRFNYDGPPSGSATSSAGAPNLWPGTSGWFGSMLAQEGGWGDKLIASLTTGSSARKRVAEVPWGLPVASAAVAPANTPLRDGAPGFVTSFNVMPTGHGPGSFVAGPSVGSVAGRSTAGLYGSFSNSSRMYGRRRFPTRRRAPTRRYKRTFRRGGGFGRGGTTYATHGPKRELAGTRMAYGKVLKRCDITATVAINDHGYYVLAVGPATDATHVACIAEVGGGTGQSQRIGRKILVKGVKLDLTYVQGPNNSTYFQHFRTMVVYDRQNNKTVPLITDILADTSDLNVATCTTRSGYNVNNKDRFMVLYDKLHRVRPSVATGFAAGPPTLQIEGDSTVAGTDMRAHLDNPPDAHVYLKMPGNGVIQQYFDEAAIATPPSAVKLISGGIFLLCFCRALTTANYGIRWASSVFFTDLV